MNLSKILKKLTSSKENRTFGFLGLEYLVKILLGTAVGVWVARYLGPSEYGNFTYVISFVLIFAPFFTMASEEVIIKELVQNREKHNFVMGNGFILKAIGSLFGICAINIVSYYFMSESDSIRLGISVFSVFMFLKTFQVIDNYFLSISNVKVISYSRSLVMAILSLMKVTLILQSKSWIYFVYVSCLELVLYMIFYTFIYYRNNKSIFSWKYSSKEFKELVLIAVPLVTISFCSMGVSKLDQIMIMHFSGSEELGRYAASVKLIELWQFVPLALISSLYPKIVESYSLSKSAFRENVKKLYTLIILFSLALATGTTIVSDMVIELLYGSNYEASGVILALYSWTILFLYLTLARNKIFIIENLMKVELIIVLITLIFNVGINYYMIPVYGAKGAVGASILSYILSNLIVSLFIKSVRDSLKDMFFSLLYIKTFIKGLK